MAIPQKLLVSKNPFQYKTGGLVDLTNHLDAVKEYYNYLIQLLSESRVLDVAISQHLALVCPAFLRALVDYIRKEYPADFLDCVNILCSSKEASYIINSFYKTDDSAQMRSIFQDTELRMNSPIIETIDFIPDDPNLSISSDAEEVV